VSDLRRAAFDRCYAKLAAVAREVGPDPLMLIDLAYPWLGAANRGACDGYCKREDYTDALLDLAVSLVETIAAWETEGRWQEAMEGLAVVLDRREFERQVHEDVWSLPERWEP
jgi:hypothetical protein